MFLALINTCVIVFCNCMGICNQEEIGIIVIFNETNCHTVMTPNSTYQEKIFLCYLRMKKKACLMTP